MQIFSQHLNLSSRFVRCLQLLALTDYISDTYRRLRNCTLQNCSISIPWTEDTTW